MAKAYWVTCYHKILDETKLAAYGKLAASAITAGGGVFLSRGLAVAAFEEGLKERTVLVEFPNLEAALSTRSGAAYQAALAALEGGAVRDHRIVEGL